LLGREGRPRVALEPGSGTGLGTGWLAERCDTVVAFDLAHEMLRRAPEGPGHRLRADAGRLPFADGAADAVVLVNAFLFPAEVDRVLAPRGIIVWVNTSGASTPIHLPAEEVEAALPGRWEGVASEAAGGTWALLTRA
jgi:SAM-dependent methyltransferase